MMTTLPDKMDSALQDIEDLHEIALSKGERSYEDPETGFTVFTELFHLKRGKCCGNLCRHCPFGWENVAQKEARRPAKVKSGDKQGVKLCLQEIEEKIERHQKTRIGMPAVMVDN